MHWYSSPTHTPHMFRPARDFRCCWGPVGTSLTTAVHDCLVYPSIRSERSFWSKVQQRSTKQSCLHVQWLWKCELQPQKHLKASKRHCTSMFLSRTQLKQTKRTDKTKSFQRVAPSPDMSRRDTRRSWWSLEPGIVDNVSHAIVRWSLQYFASWDIWYTGWYGKTFNQNLQIISMKKIRSTEICCLLAMRFRCFNTCRDHNAWRHKAWDAGIHVKNVGNLMWTRQYEA